MSVSLSTHSHHHHVAQSQKSSSIAATASMDDTVADPASSAPGSTSNAPPVDASGLSAALSGFLSMLSQLQMSSSADPSTDPVFGDDDADATQEAGGLPPGPVPTPSSSTAAPASDPTATAANTAKLQQQLLQALQAYASQTGETGAQATT